MSGPPLDVNDTEGATPIGDGHFVRWGTNGDLYWCHPGCRGWHTVDITSGKRHKLVSREPLTIQGSLLCVEFGTHGFIRDGKWVPA